MQGKLSNWVIFSRQIASDFRNGLLTRAELFVLLWLRLNGDPYGIARTSLSDLNMDVFGGHNTENYVNKLLLSLKSKSYLHFERRTGRRGSFEVHFGDWILPTGDIRQLKKSSTPTKGRTEEAIVDAPESEVSAVQRQPSQRSEQIKDEIWQMFKGSSFDEEFRGNNTDTET